MTLTTRIPLPNPADSGEVTGALDIATSLWKKGNYHDAIRWVRRAAQAADQAGDTVRMTALARASADLEDSLTAAPPIRSSAPPPLPGQLRSSVPPPPASASRVRSKTTPPPLPPLTSRPAPATTLPPDGSSRLRVSIKTSVRDPTLLVVRRLEEGMALPAGTREGWLVMPESVRQPPEGRGPNEAVAPSHPNGKSAR
jgi:hypothetical protein